LVFHHCLTTHLGMYLIYMWLVFLFLFSFDSLVNVVDSSDHLYYLIFLIQFLKIPMLDGSLSPQHGWRLAANALNKQPWTDDKG
jgi:hypothetical protein